PTGSISTSAIISRRAGPAAATRHSSTWCRSASPSLSRKGTIMCRCSPVRGAIRHIGVRDRRVGKACPREAGEACPRVTCCFAPRGHGAASAAPLHTLQVEQSFFCQPAQQRVHVGQYPLARRVEGGGEVVDDL